MTAENNTPMPESDWCLVESDPAIFTEMVRQIGVKDVRVDEVQSLDLIDSITTKGNILGLVFSTKYVEESLPELHEKGDPDAEGVYFSCQVITNACATLALLGIMLNTENNIEIGPELQNLKEFTKDFDPVSRGLAVGNSDVIKIAHNYFASARARAEAAPGRCQPTKGKSSHWVEDDAYHFVSYVPVNGFVWELDGMKRVPVKLDQCTGEDWVDVAKKFILQRMQSSDTIEANIMAVVHDSTLACKDQLDFYERLSQAAEKELSLQYTSHYNGTALDPKQQSGYTGLKRTSEQLLFSNNPIDTGLTKEQVLAVDDKGNTFLSALDKETEQHNHKEGQSTSTSTTITNASLSKRVAFDKSYNDGSLFETRSAIDQAVHDDLERAKMDAVAARRDFALESAQNIRDLIERYDTREKDEAVENKRRRHDYSPFLNALFSKLHQKGQLKDMLQS